MPAAKRIHLEMCTAFGGAEEKNREPLNRIDAAQTTFQKTSLRNLEIDYLAFLWLRKLAAEQEGEIVLQLAGCRGGPSCCNMNLGL